MYICFDAYVFLFVGGAFVRHKLIGMFVGCCYVRVRVAGGWGGMVTCTALFMISEYIVRGCYVLGFSGDMGDLRHTCVPGPTMLQRDAERGRAAVDGSVND